MAELVDALVSGTSGRKAVQVRFLFWAHRSFNRPFHLSMLILCRPRKIRDFYM